MSHTHVSFLLCSVAYTVHVHIRHSQARELKDCDRDDMFHQPLLASNTCSRIRRGVARSEASVVVFVAFGRYLREPPNCEFPSERMIVGPIPFSGSTTNIIKSVHASRRTSPRSLGKGSPSITPSTTVIR